MKERYRRMVEGMADGGPAEDTGEAPWFLYLLRCADGTLYTGITTDPARRCAQHNDGTGARYTRTRRPVTLVRVEKLEGRAAALRRELRVKALSRPGKERLIERSDHGTETDPA
jgi:predicted GIY-YIG superfamily endonuclease